MVEKIFRNWAKEKINKNKCCIEIGSMEVLCRF